MLTAAVLSFMLKRTTGLRIPDDEQAEGLDRRLWEVDDVDDLAALEGDGRPPAADRVPT